MVSSITIEETTDKQETHSIQRPKFSTQGHCVLFAMLISPQNDVDGLGE